MITLLLPLRDLHGPFLTQAVDSVLQQTNPHWKLLLLNQDQSRHTISQVLADLGLPADGRVQLAHNPTSSVSGALNLGMRLVSTEFVGVLHDDDMLAPLAVEELLKAIQGNPQVDYFHSSNRWIDEVGQFLSAPSVPHPAFAAEDFVDGGKAKHMHCWRVSSALSIGGVDESFALHGADDYDFPWSMAEAGFRFQAIPDCLYYYRDHRRAPRLTTHVPLESQIAELRRIFRKHRVAEAEIERQIERRSQCYLRQALFSDNHDMEQKLASGFDPQQGWRQHPQP